MSTEIAKLRWRCRRGMRELDKLTEYFLDQYYPRATASEQAAFQRLLALPDPELLGLILDRTEAPDAATQLVLDQMRQRS